MLKRQFVIPALVVAVVVLVLVAALRGRGGADAGASGETASVERRTFVATVLAVGAVRARIGAEVRVGSRISGRVQRLRANIGDVVQKGQVIAELETAEADATVAERRAEVELADAKLAARDTLSPEGLARARAEVARAEATEKLTAAEWDRQQQLLKDRVTTVADAEAARERHLVAQAQLASARRDFDLALRETRAEHARAVAALQRALVDQSFTVITAPIAGTIASVSTQEGETVAAGLSAPTFVTIVDLHRLQVHAYVDEVDIGKVQLGQRSAFTVDAFPARDFSGRVSAIYPNATLQDNVVKYVVVLDVAERYADVLRPEMTASVRIALEPREVLAVPARALRREGGRSVLYVVTGRRAEPRPVRVGWRDGPWLEIVEGVREGERVLLDPPASGAAPGAAPGAGGER